MKSLWKLILNWFSKQKPQPKPEPKPDPIGGDHPTFVHTQIGNVMWSSLAETAQILESTFDASGFWARTNRKWPTLGGGNPQDGTICLIWEYNGAWQGEYVDCAVAMDYKYVSYRQHCLDPESPFAGRLPVKGQKVGNVFINNAGTERTNVAWGVWQL